MDGEARGGIVDPQTWRYIEAGPPEYFIPIPSEALQLPQVRVHALLMEAARAQMMGGENGDK